MATNPLIGSGWGSSPGGAPQSPLGPSVLNLPSQTSQWMNPGGFSNSRGANEVNRNMGLSNIEAGQMKNFLAPQFAQLMGQYGGDAGRFFEQLMNLGSPYYKQKQMEAFQQGVGQNNNAMGQAQQQLRSQGYGSTPSGANAAMIGGMEQQGSQNLAEQYLQNLFQNEQMQLQGGQGLAGMASLFNPSQLLQGTSVGANIQPPQNFFQNFQNVAGSMGQFLQGLGANAPKIGPPA